MKNFSTKTRKEIISYFLVILGSALFAIGDVMFVNPYHLAPGGTYGLSNVLNTVWPWRISYYAICMDIPLLLIGTWILGPRFGFKTILSTILIFLSKLVLSLESFTQALNLNSSLSVAQLNSLVLSSPPPFPSYHTFPSSAIFTDLPSK